MIVWLSAQKNDQAAIRARGIELSAPNQIAPMLFFRHRSAEMDSLLHWIGVAVVLLIIAFGLVGFWRGPSLKPTDPASRPSEGLRRAVP
jgi:hypothetical protein